MSVFPSRRTGKRSSIVGAASSGAETLLLGGFAAGGPVGFHACRLTLPGCCGQGPLLAGLFCSLGCVLASGRAASSADCALEKSNDLLDFVALGNEGLEYLGCGHGGTG